MKKGKKGRTPQKRKNNSSTRCKKCSPMTLKDKEFVAVTILAVFVCMFLLTATNTPQNSISIVTGNAVEGLEGVSTSQIGTFLRNIIDPANADASVIKWVAFFSFVLLIWGGMSFFFEKGQGGLIKLLSLPIAFAMVYLIKPEEIFSGIIGYSALGMTIIVGLPFLAIIIFSVKLLQKESPIRTILEILVWYFYLAFMIYYVYRAFTSPETYSPGVLLIVIGGVVVSIFAIVKNEWVRNKVHKFNLESERKALERRQQAGLIAEEGRLALGQKAREMAYG